MAVLCLHRLLFRLLTETDTKEILKWSRLSCWSVKVGSLKRLPTVCSLEEVILLCVYSQKNLLKPVSHVVTPAKTVQVGFLYSVTRHLLTSQCEIIVFEEAELKAEFL